LLDKQVIQPNPHDVSHLLITLLSLVTPWAAALACKVFSPEAAQNYEHYIFVCSGKPYTSSNFSKLLFKYSEAYLGISLGMQDNRQTMKMLLKHMIDLDIGEDEEGDKDRDGDEDVATCMFGHSKAIGHGRYTLDQDMFPDHDSLNIQCTIQYGNKWHKILDLKTTLSMVTGLLDSNGSPPVCIKPEVCHQHLTFCL
jgi:hypothetical protein